MKKKLRVLIIGYLPPPIGGVSMHLDRFFNSYNNSPNIQLCIFDIRALKVHQSNKTKSFFSIFSQFFKAQIVHIHIANNIRTFITLLAKFAGKKVIYTHHNSRFKDSILFKLHLSLCNNIIIVNNSNYNNPILAKYKCKIVTIPAFIKPYKFSPIDPEILQFIRQFKFLIVANCFRLTFFQNKDLYGFDILIKAFNHLVVNNYVDSAALILVDPTGSSYTSTIDVINKLEIKYHKNIKYIGKPVDFAALIKYASVVVRPTRTDGDALTIREAIYLNKPVIASNSVPRPEGVVTFETEDFLDLATKLKDIHSSKYDFSKLVQDDYGLKIIDLYKELSSR